MNKIEKILRNDYFILAIVFFITLGVSLNMDLAVTDELWNFQNLNKMYNGFEIYKDANVIVTPLFFYIGLIFVKLFGANLFVFRLYNCIIMTIIFFTTYKILNKLKFSKKASLACTMGFIILGLIRISANYNTMALMFALIGIYMLLKSDSKNIAIYQGVLTFLIFMTKQNIGFYYTIAYLIYILIEKKGKKDKIKEFLKFIIPIIILGLSFITFLILDNNLYNFLNYTFLNIGEFSIENTDIEVDNLLLLIGTILITIAITLILLKKSNISYEQRKNIKVLLIFSALLWLFGIPIFNRAHVLLGIYVSIICILYGILIMFKGFFNINGRITKICISIVILILMIYSGNLLIEYYSVLGNRQYYYKYNEPYYGSIVEKEQYEDIKNITNYIEKSSDNVIILSERAALYMIPLNRSNGKMDLPLLGNLGMEGKDGLQKEIENMKNTKILLYNGKEKNSLQEPEDVYNFIRQEKKKVGTIGDFDIYE